MKDREFESSIVWQFQKIEGLKNAELESLPSFEFESFKLRSAAAAAVSSARPAFSDVG